MKLKFVLLLAPIIGLSACGDVNDSPEGEGPRNNADTTETISSSASICKGENDFSDIPAAYVAALTKYTTTNTEYLVNVCAQDSNGDGTADFMVIESTNKPEHESSYFESSNSHYEAYDYETNIHKYSDVYTDEAAHSAGNNLIETQNVVMKMPINPTSATTKTTTKFDTIGISLNGISFFNENAAPGDEITNELFTFDQCSGHPQQAGIYHYHVDPVCLIRDLGGDVTEGSTMSGGTSYSWIEDSGSNAGMLLGFLMDGFPVYGPIGSAGESDCNGDAISEVIDQYNGHSHCTGEFDSEIYHYHIKTASVGGQGDPVFWITNKEYYGIPGSVTNN